MHCSRGIGDSGLPVQSTPATMTCSNRPAIKYTGVENFFVPFVDFM